MAKKVLIWALMALLIAALGWAQEPPFTTVQTLRGEYPTPMSSAQLGELLNRVAWQHRVEGYGLLLKTTGRYCMSPAAKPIACDILTQKLPSGIVVHYDVLIDAEHLAEPTWRDVGIIDSHRFLPPTSSTVGPPPTLPLPPPVDLTPIFDQLRELTVKVTNIQGRLETFQDTVEALAVVAADRVKTIQDHLTAIQTRPIPVYVGKVWGFPVVLRPQP